MKFFSRAFLSLILCAVAVFHISALSPDPQALSGASPGAGMLCISADEESNWDQLVFHTTTEEHHNPKAARIYQRYHERLLACCNAISVFKTTTLAGWLPANDKPISNAAYNSLCLSSCYDYIFRLYPF